MRTLHGQAYERYSVHHEHCKVPQLQTAVTRLVEVRPVIDYDWKYFLSLNIGHLYFSLSPPNKTNRLPYFFTKNNDDFEFQINSHLYTKVLWKDLHVIKNYYFSSEK